MARVTMPQLGESVAEGTIGKWLKKPGDTVAKYEPLLEVITDKVNAEVPSPYAGILREILVEEGATVPNNAEIAVIETADEGVTAAAGPTPEAQAATTTAEAPTAQPGAPVAPIATEKAAAASAAGPGVSVEPRQPATPGPAGSDERGPVEMPDRAAAPAAPSGATAATADRPAATAATAAAGTRGTAASTERAAASAAPGGASTSTDAPPGAAANDEARTDGGAASRGDRAAAASGTPAPTATAPSGAGGETDGEARMTPAVRRLLREHGLMASQIIGTGGGGRITREDVTNYVESQRTGQPVNGQIATTGRPGTATAVGAPPASAGGGGSGAGTSSGATSAPAPATASGAGTVASGSAPAPSAPAPSAPSAQSAPGASAPAPSAPSARGILGQQVSFPDGVDEVLVPMTQMRKGIAHQMTRALQVPHAYVQVEVDATRLVRAREKTKRDFQAKEGTSLSFVPFVVKAVVNALKRNPAFNAHWTDNGLLAKRRINMGVAVAVTDGLIVPVVHDVDQLSIAGINRAIAEVAARARNNKLRLDDIQGSTFTIDNTGWFGSNMTLPIVNVPEVAILTMENITKRAVVVETDDGDTIAIRPIMNMVLGMDHRANDGAQAAAFLNDIKGWLESIDADLPLW